MKKRRIILFALAFFTWILLNWSIDLEHVLFGIAIGVFVSCVTSEYFTGTGLTLAGIKRYPWFLWYILLFIWECIKANLDGAWRVIHPDLPMNPGIVKVKTTLNSDAGLTFLANSLTLTPGTMVVDIDKEKGFLYVHWVDVKTQDIQKSTELIVSKFERVLKRIFV